MIFRKFRIATALALAPLLAGFTPLPPAKKIAVGQPAPDFRLKTFTKETITLSGLKGQVVVINLWATWCAPCKAEMPMMSAYYREHSGKGLRIFGVQTEDSVPNYQLKEVAEALAYPLALSFSNAAYKQAEAVPTTYIIDRKGVVRYAKAAAFDRRSFDAAVQPLLAESAN